MYDLLRRVTMSLVGIAMPFQTTQSINLGFYILTPIKVVTALLIVLVVLQWAFARRPAIRGYAGKSACVLLFLFAMLLSGIQAYFLGTSEFKFAVRNVMTTWFSLVIFFFLLTFTIRSVRDMDALLRGLVVGTLLVVATALAGLGGNIEMRTGTRLAGEAANPNYLASVSAVTIATATALFLTDGKTLWKPVYVAALAMAGIGLVGSLSRALYLGATGMAGLWMVRFRQLRLLPYALPVVVVLLASPLWLPEAAADRIETMTEKSRWDSSARGRLESLPYAGAAFVSNPVFGVGMLRTIPWTQEHYGLDTGVIHNAFIQIAVEAGLLGFVPFALIWWISWSEMTRSWRSVRRQKLRGDPQLRVLEFRAIFLQIAFFGLFIEAQFHPSMKSKLLWLLFALATVVHGLTRQRIAELREVRTSGAPEPAPEAGVLEPAAAATR